MKRFLKTHLKRFVPSGVRNSVKRRMAEKFVAPVTSQIKIEETSGALKCTIDDISFLAPLDCVHELNYFAETNEGRSEFDGIARAVRGGGVLFDIGAHSGLISALFCAAHPANRVFSFEPSPLSCQRLTTIRDLNRFGDRMQIQHSGIGKTSAVVKMEFDPVGGYVQTQRFDHTMWAAPQPIDVKIESISDAAARLNVIPAFLKIDIEGYEFEAIQGALDFVARYKPLIFLEVHLNYLETRQLSAKSLMMMLLDAGYQFYTTGGAKLKPSDVYDSPLPIVRIIARG